MNKVKEKNRLYWDFKGLLRFRKANTLGKCPACQQINFLFHISTGDDEAVICWPCWKK